jgi:O-antigen ligase
MAATGSALWRAGSVRPLGYRVGPCQEVPITRLAVTYVLLLPLTIFAVHGGFSFEHAAWNSGLGAVGGKLAAVSSDSETLRDRVQAWIGLAICLGVMIPQYRRIADLSQRMLLTMSLPLYAVLSALWSQDPALSLRSGLSLLITTLFALYLANCFTPRQQMQLAIFTGACVAVSSIALVILLPQFGIDHGLHEGAWQGLFTQKNVCAEATLFMLTPALALQVEGRYGQLLRALYIAVCLSIILMTQSRSGWAITSMYLVFVATLRILGRFGRKDLLPLAGSLFAAAAAVALVVIQYPSLFLSLISRSASLSGRAQIWKAASASILRHPVLGYGFDAFWSRMQGEASRVFAAAGWMVTGAHNGFLNVGLELGFVGLALVAAVLVQAFRRAGDSFHPGHAGYVDWCIGIVFLTVIYNLDERTIMATQYLPWILFTVACAGLEKGSHMANHPELENPA